MKIPYSEQWEPHRERGMPSSILCMLGMTRRRRADTTRWDDAGLTPSVVRGMAITSTRDYDLWRRHFLGWDLSTTEAAVRTADKVAMYDPILGPRIREYAGMAARFVQQQMLKSVWRNRKRLVQTQRRREKAREVPIV